MGSGFRTFTAGEVLTASNVQNYLQDQVVMTFAGSAARSSAIGTANFEEGMVSYLTDTDKVEAYNGTNWVQVGSSNQGLTLINTTSFSGVTSQSVNDVFSSTYQTYRMVVSLTSIAADSDITLRLRVSGTDATGNDWQQGFYGFDINGNANLSGRNFNISSFFLGSVDSGNNFHAYTFAFDIDRPNETQFTTVQGNTLYYSTAGNFTALTTQGRHSVATAYTGFTLVGSGTNAITGNVVTYGYNK
jgi:hypothetical protein